MWNLAKIFVVVAVCLGVAGGGWARDRSRHDGPTSRPKPMVSVSVPKTPLQFGKVSGPNVTQLKAEVTARVAANCPFRLMAAFEGLEASAGHKTPIPAAQIKVTINGIEVPVGTTYVEIARGGPTPMAGANVPVVIVMEMKGASSCPAGQYGGNLALKALIGP
jgi:hypothetical protein